MYNSYNKISPSRSTEYIKKTLEHVVLKYIILTIITVALVALRLSWIIPGLRLSASLFAPAPPPVPSCHSIV